MYESLIISAPMPGADPQPAAATQPPQADSSSLFDSLLWKESRGRQLRDDGTPVTSPKGAIGIAQVMPGTAPEAAKLAGLPFDENRYKTDAEYNKALGRAYFDKQLRDFGDPAKALAAYNAGPGALRQAERAAAAAGRPDDWLSFLPAETKDYVPTVLARAGMAQRPGQPAQPADAQAGAEPLYYVPMRGKYSSLIVQPPPDRGVFGAVNDTMIEIANAAAGGVGAVASFFSPGNAFSEGVKEFIRSGEESQSDVVKAEKARLAEEMQAAEGAGDEIGAYLSYAARNPILAAAQAAGSFAIPAGAVGGAGRLAVKLGAREGGKAAARAGMAGGAAAGMAMGGGDAAGTAYELVQATPDEVLLRSPEAQALRAQGKDITAIKDEIGRAAAREASKIPGVIGAASGLVGAERLLAGLGRAGSRAAQAGRTALVEGATEAFEEGVTAYEGQSAAARYNPEIDPTKGVAGAAAAGAVMGAGIGGVVGAIAGPDQQADAAPAVDPSLAPVAKAASEGGIASRAVMAGEQARREAQASLPPAAPPQPQVDSIGEAVSVIRAKTQEAGLLDALRSAESPVAVKQFLQDLSVAASPSARRDLREQALTRLEFATSWAEQNAIQARPAAMPDEIAPAPATAQPTPSERGARPTMSQMQAAVDRDAALTDASGAAAATKQSETLMAEAQRLEQAATLIESQPAAGATERARSASMRERASALRQRAAEVARRATAAPATQFDREQVEAQRQVALEQRLRRPAAEASPAPAPGAAPITQAEQAGLEAAAMAGQEAARRAEDAPRQAV